jgi:hypothetical protein
LKAGAELINAQPLQFKLKLAALPAGILIDIGAENQGATQDQPWIKLSFYNGTAP